MRIVFAVILALYSHISGGKIDGMAKFTIEFGPKSTERLEDLAARLEISRTDVVRRALEHYEDYVLQRDEQHQSRRAGAPVRK